MILKFLWSEFGVTSEKFLSYMVNKRGMEANPKTIKAQIEMRSLKKRNANPHKRGYSLELVCL